MHISKVRPIYTSVACNRTPGAADWNSDGLICFGAFRAVVIYNTTLQGSDVLTTMHHHAGQVNFVKWIRDRHNNSQEFLSCSCDKTAAIWSFVDEEWKVVAVLQGHTDGVTCADGIYYGEGDKETLVFTTSVDSTIKVWERLYDTTKCKQTINLNNGLCLTLRVHLLPFVKKPLLLCALDDHKIHIFVESLNDESGYVRVSSLVGHEDWVRGLDIIDTENNNILLASCSQDTYIRLWRIKLHSSESETQKHIKVEEKKFSAYKHIWATKLEAVLSGHEGWVYGVQWHSPAFKNDLKKPVYRLLSSSLDKSLIIWEQEETNQELERENGVWVEKIRVGEVGGNSLGFYGNKFGPEGKTFMGHSYNGSFHIWKLDKVTDKWVPSVVCGGHFGEVADVRWEPHKGRYLLSVSTDQTTRLHAPWIQGGKLEWHELARPQVHGYDMSSLAVISSTVFASSAEEKVIRVFQAPHNFTVNFKNITQYDLVEKSLINLPEGASVPSLGLSNKAIFSNEKYPERNSKDDLRYFTPVDLSEPPTEETLMQNTLWPEIQKLYGHGYEVYALDASPDGDLLASACRATSSEHAAILLWDTKDWQQIQKLLSHQLTVTQLAFSPNSQYLLSVSRDRRWSLFSRREGRNMLDLIATTDKSNGVHTRIIWCCSWFIDSNLFATGSRDGKVCLWTKTENMTVTSIGAYGLAGTVLTAAESVTALAFAPITNKLLAVGFESGSIQIYNISVSSENMWKLEFDLNRSLAHHLTVKRLAFKPVEESLTGNRKKLQLASCGSDHLVRIYEIQAELI